MTTAQPASDSMSDVAGSGSLKRGDKSVPWYVPSIESSPLSTPARSLLETYSHIPSSEVEKHVSEIRDEAWEIFPYPCIGGFRFLLLYQGPYYAPVLECLKSGNQTFLDLGCCFGQEIRRLVSDGVPSQKLTGADLRPEFFELGYKLFRDRNSLETKFIVADVFDDKPTSALKALEGSIDIIYAGSFLHLFGWEEQVRVCRRIIRLWKPTAESMVYGRQTANVQPGERGKKVPDTGAAKDLTWVHNDESFRRMWYEAMGKEGVTVRVEVEILALGNTIGMLQDDGTRRLQFAVFRE